MPGNSQSVIIQNLLKILASNKDSDSIEKIGTTLNEKFNIFTHSTHLEIQERSCSILEILKIAKEHEYSEEVIQEISYLFDGELNPVASKAQKKVPPPQGIDLDEWINEPLPEDEPEDKNDFSFITGKKDDEYQRSKSDSEDEEIRERVIWL